LQETMGNERTQYRKIGDAPRKLSILKRAIVWVSQLEITSQTEHALRALKARQTRLVWE